MDDDDRLDATLADLIDPPAVTAADEDRTFRQVVERAHGRIRRRRLVSAAAATAILITVGAIAVGARPPRELQVQAPASSTLPATTVSPSPALANLGPCPQRQPTTSPSASNAGIRGLAGKLVPIQATNVRVCSYFRVGNTAELDRFGRLTGAAAVALEHTANGLRLPPRLNITRCPGSPPFLVTFANANRQITVGAYCGGVLSNGTFTVSNSQQWFNELDLALTTDCHRQASSTPNPSLVCTPARGTIRGTLRLGGPTRLPARNCPAQPVTVRKLCLRTGYELGPQIPGTVTITGTNGIRRQATTTATRPFSVDLPLGIYRVTGTRSSTTSTSTCAPKGPFMVLDGSRFDVEIVCK